MRYSPYQTGSQIPLFAIIILCVLVYVVTMAGAMLGHDLMSPLALQRATFLARPWTIVTNLFVHGGIFHLLANMLTLFFFGRFLTGLIGTRVFLTIYFFGGILGNIFCLLLTPFAVIGASGAVFALGGTLAVLTPRLRVFVFPIPVPMPLWVAVIGGFVVLSFFPNVAWQGHLGGLLFGLIAGLVLRNRVRIRMY